MSGSIRVRKTPVIDDTMIQSGVFEQKYNRISEEKLFSDLLFCVACLGIDVERESLQADVLFGDQARHWNALEPHLYVHDMDNVLN